MSKLAEKTLHQLLVNHTVLTGRCTAQISLDHKPPIGNLPCQNMTTMRAIFIRYKEYASEMGPETGINKTVMITQPTGYADWQKLSF